MHDLNVDPHPLRVAALSLGAAIASTTAYASLKLWTESAAPAWVVAVAALTALSLWFEIHALRSERIGMIYITVLACEVALIAAVSYFGFDERLTQREAVGCGLIVIGAALALS